MAVNNHWFGTIRNRLLFGNIALIVLLVLAAVVGTIAVVVSGRALDSNAKSEVIAIRDRAQGNVAEYFERLVNELQVLAATQAVHDAAVNMPALFKSLPSVLPIPIPDARKIVASYYNGPFQTTFGDHNAGRNYHVEKVLTKLDAVAIAAQYLYVARDGNADDTEAAGNDNLDSVQADNAESGSAGDSDSPAGGNARLAAAGSTNFVTIDQPASSVTDNLAGSAGTGNEFGYSPLKAQLDALAATATTQFKLGDILLIGPNGNVIYSYAEAVDFGTNLKAGPWANTILGQAYINLAGKRAGEVWLSDYATYVPSYLSHVAFLGTPIYDGGQQAGTLLMQVSIDHLNTLMTFGGKWDKVGLGDTGEVYLVGRDKNPLTVSRLLRQNPEAFFDSLQAADLPAGNFATMLSRSSNVGLMTLNTVGVNKALAGETGISRYESYLGASVLGAFAPLQVLNQTWGIVAEVAASQAGSPTLARLRLIVIAAIIGLLVFGAIAVVLTMLLARSINRPLAHFNQVLRRVAQGDNEARVNLPGTDEISQLGHTFDGMLDDRIATQQRIEQENEALNNSVVSILESLSKLADRDLTVRVPVAEDVTGTVSDAINLLANSTAEALNRVRGVSDTVSNASLNVRQRSEQVQGVATSASEQATAAASEIQQTVVALRQMGEQAHDANEQAANAIRTTNEAMETVRSTVGGISGARDQIREMEKRLKRLGERSQEITAVVNIISDIAERTSVLALNASMQATAAGEAGTGFSVIADEVKRLAENASAATQQISTLVNAIQADTTDTIEAMNNTISQVVELSGLAGQAGDQMNDTREATEKLAAAVRDIAGSSKAQTDASETLLNRAYDLLQSSQQTLDELKKQRSDTESLNTSSKELVTTVSEFKLPA